MVVDRVTKELASCRPDLFEGGEPRLVRQIRRRRSHIFIYDTVENGRGGSHLWAKIARADDDADRHYYYSPPTEYERIEFIHSGISNLPEEIREMVVVPKPICFLPETTAVVTEKVDGTPLVPALVRGNVAHILRGRIDRPLELAHRIGRVLRALHGLTDTGKVAPLDREKRRRVVEDYRRQRMLDDDLMAEIERNVMACLDEVGNTPYAVTMKHGDFQPSNVMLVDRARIAIFDFWFNTPDVVLTDVCGFVMGLRALRVRYPLPRRRDYSSRLEARFLEGYFENDPVPWTALRCIGLSWLLHQYEAATTRRPRGPQRKWIDRCFRGMFRELLDSGRR